MPDNAAKFGSMSERELLIHMAGRIETMDQKQTAALQHHADTCVVRKRVADVEDKIEARENQAKGVVWGARALWLVLCAVAAYLGSRL